MIIRFSFLVAASIAAYKIKQISDNSLKQANNFVRKSGDGEEETLEENQSEGKAKKQSEEDENTGRMIGGTNTTLLVLDDNIESKFDKLCGETEFQFPNLLNNVNEVKCMLNLVKEFEDRLMKLEHELFIYYGLKEQELAKVELNNLVKIKGNEVEMLNTTIYLLQTDMSELQEQIERGALEKEQLETAKKKINELQKKIQINSNETKERLMMLKEQVARFEAKEESGIGVGIEEKLEDVKEVEMEAKKLKKINEELQIEKRVLAIKLIVTEARLTAFSNMTESKMADKIKNESNNLRVENEKLLMQWERLQQNRFSMVEEMVYQRWVNACLRHEIQTYQTPSSHPLRIERNSFHISNKKSTKISQKTSLIQKMKNWRRSMNNIGVVSSKKSFAGSSSSSSSFSRRSSMSSAPLDVSVSSVACRRRRVSFSDLTTHLGPSSEVSKSLVTDDKYSFPMDQTSTVREMGSSTNEMAQESCNSGSDKAERQIPSTLDPLTSDWEEEHKGSEPIDSGDDQISDDTMNTTTEMAKLIKSEGTAEMESPSLSDNSDNVDTKVQHLGFFFLVLVLLALIHFVLHMFGGK